MARANLTARQTARIRRAGMQPVQLIAGVVAVALLVLGIIGFTKTGVSDWSSSNTATVIGLHLTAGRNLIYVLAGVVGILLALLAGTARLYGWLLLIGFAALVLWGLAVVGTFSSNPVSGMGNPLHLAASDNWWHAGGAVLALLVAVMPARRVIVTDEPEEPVAADTGYDPVENRENTMASETRENRRFRRHRGDGAEDLNRPDTDGADRADSADSVDRADSVEDVHGAHREPA